MTTRFDKGPELPRDFATTCWSVVHAARGTNSPEALEALEQLCRSYWYPLYAYIRRRGHEAEDARDLTQEFFARLIEKDFLKAVHQGRGRFRWFLLSALKRFLINEWNRETAQKRGGDLFFVSLDAELAEGRYRLELPDETTPEKLFDRSWAMTLLQNAQEQLALEYASSGRAAIFEHLKVFLSGDRGAISCAEAGNLLGISESAAKVAIHRLRARFRECLIEQIARTVSTPAEIETEIHQLFAIFTS